jgi:hypothetical protein
MAKADTAAPRGTYYYVIQQNQNGGEGATIRRTAKDGEQHIVREGNNPKTNEPFAKKEVVIPKIIGTIESIDVFENDNGKNLNIFFSLEDNETESDRIILSLGYATPYGEDFMHKAPGIKPDVEYTVSVFNFTDDKGKIHKGIVIKNGDDKLPNVYSSKDASGNWTNKEGYPLPENKGEGYDSEDWKMYFTQRRKYVFGELQKHPLWNADTTVPVQAQDQDLSNDPDATPF